MHKKIVLLKVLKNNKIDIKEASKIFDLVDKFAGYGFNKSHAAGYGLLAYQTAYLKLIFLMNL